MTVLSSYNWVQIYHHLLDNTGKYSAELVKTVGENQYLINLIIRNVNQSDGEEEHFLRVTVKEREFTIPIILDTQKEWGEVTHWGRGPFTKPLLLDWFMTETSFSGRFYGLILDLSNRGLSLEHFPTSQNTRKMNIFQPEKYFFQNKIRTDVLVAATTRTV